jgi:chorismate synthase
MSRLRWFTAGESHGPALSGVLEGLPAGLHVLASDLDRDLARRQQGYGRGGRMKIEKDQAQITAGIRFGRTLGSPVALTVANRDWESWTERMQIAPGGPDAKPVLVPRPGHTDLAGGLKYGATADLRDILERASARETAMRVALGGLARAMLRELGIHIGSYVRSIGHADASEAATVHPELFARDAEALALLADHSEVRALDAESTQRLIAEIDSARARRDTLGGVIEVVATGVPVGLGSHVQWDRKLDGRIAQAMLSIPAMKAVELGDGFAGARSFGSEVHDPIALTGGQLRRTRNRAASRAGSPTANR